MTRRRLTTGVVVSAVSVVLLTIVLGGYVLCAFGWLDDRKPAATRIDAASGTAKKSSATGFSQTTIITTSSAKYENSRYGFKAEQPVEWTRRVSQNGDGAVLTSPDGKAVIRTYGFRNVAEKSLSEVYADMEKNQRSMFPDFLVVEKNEGLIDGHPDIEAVWTYTDKLAESQFSGPVKTKVVVTLKGEAGLGLELVCLAGDYDAFIGVFSTMVAGYKLQ